MTSIQTLIARFDGPPQPYDNRSLQPRRRSVLLNWFLWPLAIMTFVHRTFVRPQAGGNVDDFTGLWDAITRMHLGLPLYNGDYEATDPHYLYNPGASLLLYPLGFFPDLDSGRLAYIILNSIAIFGALALLIKIFDHKLSSPIFPIAVVFISLTETMSNTLSFANINGVLFLLEVFFIYGILKKNTVLTGMSLGLAAVIKPMMIPLFFLLVIKGRWKAMGIAVLIMVLTNVGGVLLAVDAQAYMTTVVPYLQEVRPFANSSIIGNGRYWGAPSYWVTALRLFIFILVGIAVTLLLRYRNRDELTWITASIGIILSGVFLVSSLGQMYYSILLFPFIFTVLRQRSLFHNPVMWLGVYLYASLDSWYMANEWGWFGSSMEQIRATIGWSLLILSSVTTLILWTWEELYPQSYRKVQKSFFLRATMAGSTKKTSYSSSTTTEQTHPRKALHDS